MKKFLVKAYLNEEMELEAETEEEAIEKMRGFIEDYVADIEIKAEEIKQDYPNK